MGGGPKPGGRSQGWVCATRGCPLLPGPVKGPGSLGGSERPTAPVFEVASLRDTTPFVMGGGGYEGDQSRPVWCPEADIALARCATSAHERKGLGGGQRGTKNRVPRVEGVDAALGDEKKPVKRTSKGREVGESALSTKPLSDCGLYAKIVCVALESFRLQGDRLLVRRIILVSGEMSLSL